MPNQYVVICDIHKGKSDLIYGTLMINGIPILKECTIEYIISNLPFYLEEPSAQQEEPKRFYPSELIKYFNDRKEILFKKHDSTDSSLSLEARISELDQAIAWVELQTNER